MNDFVHGTASKHQVLFNRETGARECLCGYTSRLNREMSEHIIDCYLEEVVEDGHTHTCHKHCTHAGLCVCYKCGYRWLNEGRR